MDPLGIVGMVAAAGWILGKLTDQKSHKPPPSNSKWRVGETVVATKPLQRQPLKARPTIDVLPEYELVKKLVDSEFPITFVTGGAGTGKSTFIEWLTQQFDGHVLVAAPTGIAALNVNGKTLHSLCKLPPAWLVIDDIKTAKTEIAKNAKLLIIDEISMVNANLLDGVSAFFRKNRGVKRPFGGLPVVIVGDLFQLPPVISKEVQHLFEIEYATPKFFGAKTLAKAPYYAVELKKAFRQVDQSFVDLLAQIREGVNIQSCLEAINSKVQITDCPDPRAIWLSPRNAEVELRNDQKLKEISSPMKQYIGRIHGTFKGDRFPTPERVNLKVGALVMLTKNSSEWVNGSTGEVVAMHEDRIEVRLHSNDLVVEVPEATWEQFDYEINKDTRQIERKVIGSYVQIPAVLAWASTIHKSQGKTLERVHIDLGAGAFETGQTYVALSRCRTLDNLSLSRPLRASDILVDLESRDFYQKLRALIEQIPPAEMANRLSQSESSLH